MKKKRQTYYEAEQFDLPFDKEKCNHIEKILSLARCNRCGCATEIKDNMVCCVSCRWTCPVQ